MRPRLIELVLRYERVAEVMMCLGVVRLELQRPPEPRLGLPRSALVHKSVAEVVIGQRVARLERDRSHVMGNTLLATTKDAKGRSDIAMKVRDPVVQCDGFADQVDRYV